VEGEDAGEGEVVSEWQPTISHLMLGLRFAAHKRGYILPTMNVEESPEWIADAIKAYRCEDELCLVRENGSFREVFAKVFGRELQ